MLIAEDGPANAEHKRTMTLNQRREGQLPRLAMAIGKPLQKLTVGQRTDCSKVEQRTRLFLIAALFLITMRQPPHWFSRSPWINAARKPEGSRNLCGSERSPRPTSQFSPRLPSAVDDLSAMCLALDVAGSAGLFLAVGSLIGYFVLMAQDTGAQEFPFLEGSAQAT